MDLGLGQQRADASIDLRHQSRLSPRLRATSRLHAPATVIRKISSRIEADISCPSNKCLGHGEVT
jgi:hypothetical protein